MREGKVKGVVADGYGYPGRRARPTCYHAFIKTWKRRWERRKAKSHPDCLPTYGRYSAYES